MPKNERDQPYQDWEEEEKRKRDQRRRRQYRRVPTAPPNYMARETYQRLTERLDWAIRKRKEAGLAIGETGEGGDWHENAPFENAHQDYTYANALIGKYNKLLHNAIIIEPRQEADTVQVGNTVVIHWESANPEENSRYTILGGADNLTNETWISFNSPLGNSLIGKKFDEGFSYSFGGQVRKGTIVAILPGQFGTSSQEQP